MDQPNCRERTSLRKEGNSSSVFNMETIKGKGRFFGDISYKSRTSNCDNEIRSNTNYRLNVERMKAVEAIQKSQRAEVLKTPYTANAKENSEGSVNLSLPVNHTDYVPFPRPNTAINISDLVTDETINLEASSSCPTPVSKDNVKVSFEPSEITGRSTLYNKDMKTSKGTSPEGNAQIANNSQKTKMSVSDILASSFAPKARNLCETLFGDAVLNTSERHGTAVLSARTSFSSLSGTKSLPRTADMSLSRNSCTEESFNRGLSFSSAGAGASMDGSEMFAPGELMQSKLVNDEISWAQEYAAIPAATLSKQASEKILLKSGPVSNGFETPSTSNSLIAGDPDFSIGNFFNMRSEKIYNIVKSTSPDKCRTPVALVDEDNTVTTTSDLEGSSKISVTPRIDNKTYTHIEPLTATLEKKKSLPKPVQHLNQESKDSGNSTDDSYLLSFSAIDRALYNLDIQSNTSAIGVSEQLLMQGKKAQLNSKIVRGALAKPDIPIAVEKILENKENLDPCQKRSSGGGTSLGDTLSFTESLLNSSDMKNIQRSFAQPRSPLSPIDVTIPAIRINEVADDGVEADNDEWPGTPVNSDRRVRRKKSPRDKSPLKSNIDRGEIQDATTPVNTRPSRGAYASSNQRGAQKEPKSLSSTRIDGAVDSTSTNHNFGISPNLSNTNNCVSSLVVRSNTINNPPQLRSPNPASPSRMNNSPITSPCSYHLSQLTSPTPSTMQLPSPNLDATPSCDRQLFGAGAVRKAVSSPVGSEASSTCSYGTYRSAASGRSVSRCSSTSEFSHRDGKPIPLKITNMELSWGSIKLRSDSRKSMQIKNITNKRLVLRVEASGPGFQIVNSQRSNTITLHSQECRTISISFCPTVRGVAVGKLSFYAPSGTTATHNSFLDVPLFAYGGNASIIAQNIFIGPVGAPFVTMGDICELAQPLERSISFYNKGPLLGFASVSVDSIGLMIPRLSDAFEIHPKQILIPPKSVVNVHIVFNPKREEIRKIIKKSGSVLTLANLRVICGDEANRQRIRRLLPQMSEQERSKLSSSSLDMVFAEFPQEIEISELHDVKENTSAAIDLLSFFRIHEILLTINHDNTDDTFDTSSLFLADTDETVLFRTVCAAADSLTPSPNLRTVDEQDEEYNAEPNSKPTQSANSWSVSPQTLDININKPLPVTLRLQNGFKSRQFFEVVCNVKKFLHFQPNDGYILPDGGEAEIIVSLQDKFVCPTDGVFIVVYMENERIMVPVNIIK